MVFWYRNTRISWEFPLVRKLGHMYLTWPDEILYTQEELRKVHRHFYHPDSQRLFSVLRRANPEECSSQTLAELEDVEEECDICQRLSKAPSRFRVSMPHDSITFNRLLFCDLMFLEGKPVLHCVEKDTKFNVAAFLTGESVDDVWRTYQMIWSLKYVGHPDTLHADQGPQFHSRRFKGLIHLSGISLKLSGVESHNALGEGERYHSYLRHIYNKVKAEHTNIDPAYVLQLAIKALNDTAGPKGLVPTLLVFGALPRTPIEPTELPGQIQRMEAMKTSRKEMAAIMAQCRVNQALRSQVPAAAMSDIVMGSEVLVFRESPKQWIGPYRVIDTSDKLIFVEVDGSIKQFSVDKVKLYKRSEAMVTPDESSTSNPLAAIDDAIAGIRGDLSALNPATDELDALSAEEFLLDSDINVALTREIRSHDPAANTKQFWEAKRNEVDGLHSRQTWDVINKEDVPLSANVLGG